MNSRRQSLDRPGILSPPGPFLTPSPSPSISAASPRLAPSPSISPFSQDVLLVANSTITNTTQEQERKAATPSRRHSINQLNNSGSPNAGTVVFQPSPSQSPAAATTVIGVTGNEFNTTLVGSNNISLNKKGKRSSQTSNFISNYGQTTAANTAVSASGAITFAPSPNYMASTTKGQTKKIAQQAINPSSSPLLADSPISSPSSNQMKPPTPQPQILQQQQIPTVINTTGGNQILQFLQGQQIINATSAIQSIQPPQSTHQHQFHSQNLSRQISTSLHNTSQGPSIIQQTTVPATTSTKTTKAPQQILPKPNLDNNKNSKQPPIQQLQPSPQISQSPGPQQIATATTPQPQSGPIILPTGNLAGQSLVLNQMPVIVQQNTPQGVQLILRPPTPQLATAPSLVIHNTRPQLQQQPQQQLLRILNTNGAMQIATTPTFIVSSQANLIQQNLQTIKATPTPQSSSQATATAMTTALNSLQAAVTNPQQQQQRSQQIAAAINNHIFNQNMAAQLQNLQINGNLTQIQLPNGIHTATATPVLSQIPQFQQSIAAAGFNQQIQQNINLNQINTANLQQIAAAAAAAGATFQSPPPPNMNQQSSTAPGSTSASPQLVTEINQLPSGASVMSTTNLQFAAQNNGTPQHITIKSPAVTPQPHIIQSITPEPTVMLANNGRNTTNTTAATVLVQPDHIIQQIQQQQFLAANNTQQRATVTDVIRQQPPPPKARKSNKGRKKKIEQTQIVSTVIPSLTTTTSSLSNNVNTNTVNSNNFSTTGVLSSTASVPFTTSSVCSIAPSISSNSSSTLTSNINESLSSSLSKRDTSSPPLKSTGKLDLANVMKLCGIMEDDDYMMDDEPLPQTPTNQNPIPQTQLMPPQDDYTKFSSMDIENSSITIPTSSPNVQQTQSQQQTQSSSAVSNVNETSDIMITIPSQSNNEVPFSFTIPTSQCDNNNKTVSSINSNLNSTSALQPATQSISNFELPGNSIISSAQNVTANLTVVPAVTSQNQTTTNMNEEQIQIPQNFVIKIDSNDVGGQPYTISIPGLTSNDIQQQISMIQTQPSLQGLQLVPQSPQSLQLQITPTTASTSANIVPSTTMGQISTVSHNQQTTIQSYVTKSNTQLLSGYTAIPTTSVPVSSVTSPTTTTTCINPITTNAGSTGAVTITTFANQLQPAPTITSRMTEIQNSLIGVNAPSQQLSYLQSAQVNQQAPSSSVLVSTAVCSIPVSSTIPVPTLNTSASSINSGSILTTSTTTTTTAAIKPRRKQPVKRANKKTQPILMSNNAVVGQTVATTELIPTTVCNVPSQIGNIQISQIDATKQQGQNQLPSIATNIVENKIQIMPIIDSAKNVTTTSASTVISQPNFCTSANPIITTNSLYTTSSTTSGIPQTQQIENISNVPINSSTAASLITQLTGALSLAFSEDGTRLMLRHDPNTPQDSQSQIILQAVLSGALPNMTIINESVDKSKTTQITPASNQKVAISAVQQQQSQQQQSQNTLQNVQAATATNIQTQKLNSINQSINSKVSSPQSLSTQTTSNVVNQPPSNSSQFPIQSISNDSLALLQKRPSLEVKKNEVPLTNISQQHQFQHQPAQSVTNIGASQTTLPSTSVVVTPKIVALPKIEANQQLFSLNTITNQITQINPNQTTASLGPMERLLIVPAGINAQQLSQCMLQGQIHFDNINPVASEQSSNSQSQQMQIQQNNLPVGTAAPRIQQQQIVHPLTNQQQSTSKQVANVAPIIDASRVGSVNAINKIDQLKNSNASAIAAAVAKRGKPRKQKVELTKNSTLKPIQKLNLSTKPNNTNLVQIVQPTSAVQQSQQQQSQQNLNKDQNLPRSIASGSFTSQTLTGNGTKLVGVTAPMQQINRTNTLPGNTCTTNIVNTTPMVMNSANVINSIRTQNSNNPNLSNIMPPLISVNPAQTTVTRVQTIQLTPQQQQLLKNVQMQIQQLSTKLKNTNLLSTLNIPADFDPNNPMYSKPLPSLHNINTMTDIEIHAALQRLFIEQQKILASGKIIPTIQAPSVGGFASLITQSPQQIIQTAQQQSPTGSIQLQQNSSQMQSKFLVNAENQNTNNLNLSNQKPISVLSSKNDEKSSIPSNVVQPNNHNNTISSNSSNNCISSINNCSATQRIQVYPLQQNSTIGSQNQVNIQNQQIYNQQQMNSQQPQMISPQQTQQVFGSNGQLQLPNLQNNKNISSSCLKQQPKYVQQTNNKQFFPNSQFSSTTSLDSDHTQNQVNQLLSQQHQQQPQQQSYQQLFQQSDYQNQNSQQATEINKHHNSNSFLNNIKLENDEGQDLKPPMSNEKHQEMNKQIDEKKSSIQIMESPKPKIARHALFERQLEVDQLACVKPDYVTPFQSKEEAVKRLIRYHCVYQNDEEFQSDDDYELEKAAMKFQDEFENLSNKYKQLILKESILPHRTSELCLINRLLVTDIQTELLQMRSEASKAYYDFETSPDTFNPSPIPIKSDPDSKCDIENAFNQEQETSKFFLSDGAKSDIKKEPYDFVNSFKIDDDCSTTNSFSQNTNSSSSGSNNEISSIGNKENDFNSDKISDDMFAKEESLNEKEEKEENKEYDDLHIPKNLREIKNNKKSEPIKNFSTSLKSSANYDTNMPFQNKNNITNKFCNIQSDIKKENLENFDIESEITPSFILKKIDSKQPPIDLPFAVNSSSNVSQNSKFSSINENKFPSTFDKISDHKFQIINQIPDRKNSVLNDNKFSHNKFNHSKQNQIINGPSSSKFSNETRFNFNEQHRSNFINNNDCKVSLNPQSRNTENMNKFSVVDCKSSHQSVTLPSIKSNNKFHPLHDEFNTDDDDDGDDESNETSNDFSLDFNFEHLKDSRNENNDISKRNEFTNPSHQNNPEQNDYNEWLTLQKELTLMTEKKSENQHQNLLLHQQIRSTQNMQIHHQQMTLSQTNAHLNVSKSVEKQLSEIFESASPTPKDVDSQLSELFNSTNTANDILPNGHITNVTNTSKLNSNNHNMQLSELINSEIININHNSIGSKAVETRLDSMFGESPVIEKTDNASDIVESHLNDIFNNTPTQTISTSNEANSLHQQNNHLSHFNPQRIDNQNFSSNNHLLNNAKRPWTSLDHSDILGESNDTNRNASNNINSNVQELASKRICISNSFGIEDSSTSSSHQQSSRWILENHFGDFLSTTNVESATEKNRWNGQNHLSSNNILNDSQINKKTNDDIVDSWTSHHHDSHYNLHEPDFPQIDGITVNSANHLDQHNNQDHNLQHNFPSHDTVFGTPHSHLNNHSNINNAHISGTNSSVNQNNSSITSNFDDDINRHVQNAIDSILNLQNSESDSLNFSLDHSMGSFLADSPLDHHNQHQQQQPHRNQQQASASSVIDNSNCVQTKRNRNKIIDDLSDCLISGAVGDNSNIMINSPAASNNAGTTVITVSENNSAERGNANNGSNNNDHSIINNNSNNNNNNSNNSNNQNNNNGNRHTGNLHNITDFSCVGTGLDEAVKSIMTS
ncbi:mucin-2 isoform X2 [Condylostylus longicornis]|uniref:mucin-2 isoform X2 n=1 Tax=Condylostylus longicornis TaxID=2530218 RepID=UPI00244E11DA|nr:mucin-2 isoform X2 [Condylostylus longicornis]